MLDTDTEPFLVLTKYLGERRKSFEELLKSSVYVPHIGFDPTESELIMLGFDIKENYSQQPRSSYVTMSRELPHDISKGIDAKMNGDYVVPKALVEDGLGSLKGKLDFIPARNFYVPAFGYAGILIVVPK